MKSSNLVVGILVVDILVATAYSQRYTRKPPPCRDNDDLRCFTQSRSAATPFCSSWISIPVATTTINGYITTETQQPQTQEPAPDCLTTTDLSPYASRLINNACTCLSIPTSTTTVAPAATTTEV